MFGILEWPLTMNQRLLSCIQSNLKPMVTMWTWRNINPIENAPVRTFEEEQIVTHMLWFIHPAAGDPYAWWDWNSESYVQVAGALEYVNVIFTDFPLMNTIKTGWYKIRRRKFCIDCVLYSLCHCLSIWLYV